jgi:hypothetical protein
MSNTWQTDSEQTALDQGTTALRDQASRHNKVVSERWNHSDSVDTRSFNKELCNNMRAEDRNKKAHPSLPGVNSSFLANVVLNLT